MPDFDFTSEMSELLISPFAVTSPRKFEELTAWPDRDLICEISDEFTAPLLVVVSPTRTPCAADGDATCRALAIGFKDRRPDICSAELL